MIQTLLVLGATGDLARRFLLPAVAALDQAGRLPAGFRVVGAARTALDDEQFQQLAGDVLPADAVTYRRVDLGDPSTLEAALDGTQDAVAAYLALPPGVFATTIASLHAAQLPPDSRIVVEKPFGENLQSAHELNALLARSGLNPYRVDHVLGMETARNLLSMRRENPVLARIWTGDTIGQVGILWEETLALEGRAGYYDRAGALKDVLQNHMLQLLALVAMSPPESKDLGERKLDALRSVGSVVASRRARYTAGTLADGRVVGAYADEEGVDPARCTETYAEVALRLDGPLWHGTTVLLRAGKALERRRKLVRLQFRGGAQLNIGIDGPTDVTLRLLRSKGDWIDLRAPTPNEALPPYAHVLLDVLNGTSDLSVGADEAEEAWRIVAPALAAWESGRVPLEEYPAGSAPSPLACDGRRPHDLATT